MVLSFLQTGDPVASPARPTSGAALLAPHQGVDRRADAQARTVSLTRDVVRIDRRLKGIAMRVAVPVRDYVGVALSLRPDADGALSYRLNLLHPDRDLSVTLDEAADDADILADWRLWSRFFRLPALVERQAGVIEPADPSLGALSLGSAPDERRATPLKRRPRFLQRRKPGSLSTMATVFAGEREIIARD